MGLPRKAAKWLFFAAMIATPGSGIVLAVAFTLALLGVRVPVLDRYVAKAKAVWGKRKRNKDQ